MDKLSILLNPWKLRSERAVGGWISLGLRSRRKQGALGLTTTIFSSNHTTGQTGEWCFDEEMPAASGVLGLLNWVAYVPIYPMAHLFQARSASPTCRARKDEEEEEIRVGGNSVSFRGELPCGTDAGPVVISALGKQECGSHRGQRSCRGTGPSSKAAGLCSSPPWSDPGTRFPCF